MMIQRDALRKDGAARRHCLDIIMKGYSRYTDVILLCIYHAGNCSRWSGFPPSPLLRPIWSRQEDTYQLHTEGAIRAWSRQGVLICASSIVIEPSLTLLLPPCALTATHRSTCLQNTFKQKARCQCRAE